MKKEKQNIYKSKGITLIALVITIVVLLILAAVSISMLTGENGIIRQAQNSKTKSEIAEEKEQIVLAYNEEKINNLGKQVLAADLNEQFTINGVDATASGSNKIKVKFNESGREYTIDSNGVIAGPTAGENDEVANRELVVEDIIYTRSQNNLNLSTIAYELEPIEGQYISEISNINMDMEDESFSLSIKDFELQEDGTIVSENLEEFSNETMTMAFSQAKIDLTDVEEDLVVDIEATVSGGIGFIVASDVEYDVTSNPTEAVNNGSSIMVQGESTDTTRIHIQAGTKKYLMLMYAYVGKDAENGITDSLTIKFDYSKKITDSELTYKYKVNGKAQINNVIKIDLTKLEGKEAVEGENPKVPIGFTHLNGTIDEGYVITDIDKNYIVEVEVKNSLGKIAQQTKEITGNEFVWIPVNEDNPFERRKGYNGETQSGGVLYGEADSTGTNDYIAESEITQAEAIAMYQSVSSNGGFYIGRYEAGREGGRLGTDDNGDMTWKDATVVTKKGANLFNWVKWGNSMTDETGGAVEIARNFASIQGYDTTQVHSTLCYGVQWDTALNFIDPGYTGYAKDSTGKGKYEIENILSIKTGTNDNYSIKNIYDMAGNATEWTMESWMDEKRVIRGGSVGDDVEERPASSRVLTNTYNNSGHIGFRIALYLE